MQAVAFLAKIQISLLSKTCNDWLQTMIAPPDEYQKERAFVWSLEMAKPVASATNINPNNLMESKANELRGKL